MKEQEELVGGVELERKELESVVVVGVVAFIICSLWVLRFIPVRVSLSLLSLRGNAVETEVLRARKKIDSKQERFAEMRQKQCKLFVVGLDLKNEKTSLLRKMIFSHYQEREKGILSLPLPFSLFPPPISNSKRNGYARATIIGGREIIYKGKKKQATQ